MIPMKGGLIAGRLYYTVLVLFQAYLTNQLWAGSQAPWQILGNGACKTGHILSPDA